MFTKKQFDQLSNISQKEQLCVSIFIPTYRAGNSQEDKLRFKNALSESVEQLVAKTKGGENEMDKKAATKFLKSGYLMLDDDGFWTNLSDGLAVFISEDYYSFHVTHIDFTPFVHVADHFYLRHLLPLVSKKDRFFVLALSQNEVRFFEGKASSITPVKIDDLIPNGKEEMIAEGDQSQTLQAHSGSGNNAVFHGQGSGKDQKNEDLKKYFREIDKGLMTMLHDENIPMVLFSVDSQIPIYKEVSNYSNIVEEHISGNPENDDAVLIHEKAWAVVGDYFEEEKNTAINQFNEEMANRKATIAITNIVPSAINGKIDTLFVDKDKTVVWGVFDKKNNRTIIHEERQPDSVCLLNEAAISTYENGGTVYNIPRIEFPNSLAEVNAVFRY